MSLLSVDILVIEGQASSFRGKKANWTLLSGISKIGKKHVFINVRNQFFCYTNFAFEYIKINMKLILKKVNSKSLLIFIICHSGKSIKRESVCFFFFLMNSLKSVFLLLLLWIGEQQGFAEREPFPFFSVLNIQKL